MVLKRKFKAFSRRADAAPTYVEGLNGFISKGNPRIFSVASLAARSETVKVEILPLDNSDMADLEEMYEGFSDENKPDKEAWMSGYKLNIR